MTGVADITKAAAKALMLAQIDIVDKVLEILGENVTAEITEKLKAMKDDIVAKSVVKIRKPRGRNAYQEFLSVKMLEFKGSNMTSQEKLKAAQDAYREHKVTHGSSDDSSSKKTTSSESNDEEVAEKPKTKKGVASKSKKAVVDVVEETDDAEDLVEVVEEPKKKTRASRKKN